MWKIPAQIYLLSVFRGMHSNCTVILHGNWYTSCTQLQGIGNSTISWHSSTKTIKYYTPKENMNNCSGFIWLCPHVLHGQKQNYIYVIFRWCYCDIHKHMFNVYHDIDTAPTTGELGRFILSESLHFSMSIYHEHNKMLLNHHWAIFKVYYSLCKF